MRCTETENELSDDNWSDATQNASIDSFKHKALLQINHCWAIQMKGFLDREIKYYMRILHIMILVNITEPLSQINFRSKSAALCPLSNE